MQDKQALTEHRDAISPASATENPAAGGTRPLRRRLAPLGWMLFGLAFGSVLLTTRVHGLHDAFAHEGAALTQQLAVIAREAVALENDADLQRVAYVALGNRNTSALILKGLGNRTLIMEQRRLETVRPQTRPIAYLLVRLLRPFTPTRFEAPVQRPLVALSAMPNELAQQPAGRIVVEFSLDEFARTREAGFRNTLLWIATLSLGAPLLSGFRNRHRRRLLTQLRRAVGRMRDGDLRTRLTACSAGDLAPLIDDLNDTAESLYQSKLALQAQVDKTTSELRQTLEAVEIKNIELDAARRRALEASKVKSEFLANMSHEIRTPINGILGFADLLAHSSLDEEQRDYVNTIKDSCANLLTIVNDILDFSKIEAGKLMIDSVAFDLRDSVEEVMSLLAPTAYGKSLELAHLLYADVPAKLYGDPIRIRQVLTNLVHNAIKFTPSGRVVVRVMLEDESEHHALLRIAVSDTGIGLSKDDQAKLFHAFGQADTSITRRFGGAGLGLIISRKLVEQMGGTIGFESESNQGSTFWFTLRCLTQPNASSNPGERRESQLQGKRALIYDEDSLSRLSLKHVLERWRMQITEVDDRQRLVSMVAAESKWDLIIVGVNRNQLHARMFQSVMPRLKQVEAPVLALVSTVDRGELRSLYQHGARAALPKVLRRHTLYRELCRLLPTPAPTDHSSAHSAPPALISHKEPSRHTAPQGRPVRVLVVDDNQINRKLVSTILHLHGARVLEATDGQEAVEIAKPGALELIFMDIHMPTMSGETAAQLIRANHEDQPAPRIVALTANAMPGERERLLDSGMDDCLIKPITEEQVAVILEQVRATGPAATASPLEELAPGSPPHPNADATSPRPPALHELQAMLEAELPQHRMAISQAFQAGRLKQLKDGVHKLHGAASVCRHEPLRKACASLETALAANESAQIAGKYRRLVQQIDLLLPGVDVTKA